MLPTALVRYFYPAMIQLKNRDKGGEIIWFSINKHAPHRFSFYVPTFNLTYHSTSPTTSSIDTSPRGSNSKPTSNCKTIPALVKIHPGAATGALFSCLLNSPSNTNSLAVSQYELNIKTKGTQKGLFCITQKQAIGNKWKFQPKRATLTLNPYLGVEINHCTGSAW